MGAYTDKRIYKCIHVREPYNHQKEGLERIRYVQLVDYQVIIGGVCFSFLCDRAEGDEAIGRHSAAVQLGYHHLIPAFGRLAHVIDPLCPCH